MSFPASSMPGSQSAGALSQTAAIRQRLLNYLQRLYLFLHLTRCLRMAAPTSKPPSKPLLALILLFTYHTSIRRFQKNVNGMNRIFCSDMSIKAERQNSFYGGFGSQNMHRMLYLRQKEICISVKKHKMDKKTGYDKSNTETGEESRWSV